MKSALASTSLPQASTRLEGFGLRQSFRLAAPFVTSLLRYRATGAALLGATGFIAQSLHDLAGGLQQSDVSYSWLPGNNKWLRIKRRLPCGDHQTTTGAPRRLILSAVTACQDRRGSTFFRQAHGALENFQICAGGGRAWTSMQGSDEVRRPTLVSGCPSLSPVATAGLKPVNCQMNWLLQPIIAQPSLQRLSNRPIITRPEKLPIVARLSQ